MNNKAFNIFLDNEKDFYPKDCQIDTLLDKDIEEFFKSQKNETEKYNLIKKTKHKNEDNNNESFENGNDNGHKINNEYNNFISIEEEDECSSSSELIYSTFPDNIELIKKNIYEKMHINKKLIDAVIEEYFKTKNRILNESKKEENLKNNSQKSKLIINHKKFNKYKFPKNDIINNKIIPYISNDYLMKNINKCFKVLKSSNIKNKNELEKLSEWFYTFLLFLEMPLIPEYNADLYSINKYIYNNFIKVSELKIIFIIICEIFKQILIL